MLEFDCLVMWVVWQKVVESIVPLDSASIPQLQRTVLFNLSRACSCQSQTPKISSWKFLHGNSPLGWISIIGLFGDPSLVLINFIPAYRALDSSTAPGTSLLRRCLSLTHKKSKLQIAITAGTPTPTPMATSWLLSLLHVLFPLAVTVLTTVLFAELLVVVFCIIVPAWTFISKPCGHDPFARGKPQHQPISATSSTPFGNAWGIMAAPPPGKSS
jgi:hypothetical protein